MKANDININQIKEVMTLLDENDKNEFIYDISKEKIDWLYENKPINFNILAKTVRLFLNNWNISFYRYGKMDLLDLKECIRNNHKDIVFFRNKDILNFSNNDFTKAKNLFDKFLNSTKISVKEKSRFSPVSVAKTLHLLAPDSFIPWDNAIAKGYYHNGKKCYWYHSSNASNKYVGFLIEIRIQVLKLGKILKNLSDEYDKNVLRIIDIYNLFKYKYKQWD